MNRKNFAATRFITFIVAAVPIFVGSRARERVRRVR
jgi:hypothetical protein